MDTPGIDVEYVAQLARLEIAPEAMPKLRSDMAAIVGYIAELQEVDVEGVEPTAYAVPLSNVWREDSAGESFPRGDMLANAPALVDDTLIKVPQVLPGEGIN
ncbi:MAG: Asp-tRNA(Asn)/Glu-tRNA(Gln) amidotransferase subunit GatC [Lentisphaeria bacterium]|nr:Asp-tRNA(Asn)/Glu-tRNA(Gln) amidotransferase subunit GatC [Lentisphaeria bacterium]